MAETEAVVGETQDVASPPPAWVGDLTRSQKREIKACLSFLYKPTEDPCGWAWHAEHANMTASVIFGAEKNSLIITVTDDDAGEEIELWRTELRLSGNWKRRLRQFSGEALVLCQSRPRCPKCGALVVLVRRRDGSVQFFGCTKFRSTPRCNGSLNIIDHDVERPS